MSKLDLVTLINSHKLPFFAQYYPNDTNSDKKSNNSSDEIIFLYKLFETKCLIAKCFSSILQNYLIHHRPSYVPSDNTPQITINQKTNGTSSSNYLFNDIVAIPYNYKGRMFNIFKEF